MGRLLFISLGITLVLLFIPIYFVGDLHVDSKKEKAIFSIRFFGLVKLLGGYITLYEQGLAFHVGKKRAILLPFFDMESGKKQFSVFKSFHFHTMRTMIQTGCDYFIPSQVYMQLSDFFWRNKKIKENEHRLLIVNGDAWNITVHSVFWLNIWRIVKRFIKFLYKKWRILWQKKGMDFIG